MALHLAWDVNHPLVQCIDVVYVFYLLVIYLLSDQIQYLWLQASAGDLG